MAEISGYRRKDAQHRYVKTHNDIDYVFGKLDAASNKVTLLAYKELVEMSKAFLDSYTEKRAGQSALPRYTGNLLDSTSIIVAKGTKRGGKTIAGTEPSEQEAFYTQIAEVKQHWGDCDGTGKGSGYGKDYRIDDIREVMDVKPMQELAVVLHVGIPYAVPLNENGGLRGRHRGFFDWFAEDFKYDVMRISEKVARAINYGEDALHLEGKIDI